MSYARPSLSRPESDDSVVTLTEDNITTLSPSPKPESKPLLGSHPFHSLSEKYPRHLIEENATDPALPPQDPPNKLGFTNHFLTLLVLLIIIAMLVWPWVFFILAKQRKGLMMNQTLSDFVRYYPQDVDFFVTAISSIITFIVGTLFRFSVTQMAQKWVTFEETDIFRLSFFSALKNRTIIWPLRTLPSVLKSTRRFGLVFTVGLYMGIFLFVTPGLTALLHPQTLIRRINISHKEIYFSSNKSECLDWFNRSQTLLGNCSWTTRDGKRYTTCLGEIQMIDALESGRNNLLLPAPDSFTIATLAQLGGLQFNGPLKGVMVIPLGRTVAVDGSTPQQLAEAFNSTSYNHTLQLQGIQSNIHCHYDESTPIMKTPHPSAGTDDDLMALSRFSASCPPGRESLMKGSYPIYSDPKRDNTLSYWACVSSPPNGPKSYDLYFRGRGLYFNTTGNMSCSVSLPQSAIFPVRYHRDNNLFSVDDISSSSISPISPNLIQNAFISLGYLIREAQQFTTNSIADSVTTFGVKSYGLEPFGRNETYMRLYEKMIQGILDYQLTYIRLLYSMGVVQPAPPIDNCTRSVEGIIQYPLVGWEMTGNTATYITPLTLILITSLIFMLIAIIPPNTVSDFDPTNPTFLLVAATGKELSRTMEPIRDYANPVVWQQRLNYDEGKGRFLPD